MTNTTELYFLIHNEETSVKDVLASLVEHENDTDWSAKTTHFAISHIKEFEKKYYDCVRGFLPKELFLDTILPFHGHMKDFETGILLFPDNISVKNALEYCKKPNLKYTKECADMILFLKDQIKNNRFTSEVTIESVDGKLRHIDGLHRMIALGLLLEEGYEYKPIPVYVLKR